ncbi:hypothetical protein M422DRAFT_28286 [Sphaerobolus stellatus SS14]|nr:hypothetical protein M422DRAFT_28286 [Sphaerobolus stellatus SS14]
MSRDAHALAILSPALHSRLANLKVLIVGSGGIGCELLKNVVLTDFGHITLLDLDTIDLSNLNRQFLFRKKDVKQPKSLVAAKTAVPFNRRVHIEPLHANIKEPHFDVPCTFNPRFSYDVTECFDCLAKPTTKTFPVCTIRSTPSQPIHCIVWAKLYLFPQLFGEDEEDQGELDEAEKQGENAKEIENLRREAQAFKTVRKLIRTPGESDAARQVFEKVSPTPLDYESIINTPVTKGDPTLPMVNGNTAGSGLKDQKSLSLRETLDMFIDSANRLAARLSKPKEEGGEETISFDKDDEDTLDFVCAAANLRSVVYGIPNKTGWEVKEMAGNIIPATASTNAVIAGLIVLQALHLLRASQPSNSALSPYSQLRNVHLQHKPAIPLQPTRPVPPNQKCAICRDTYIDMLCDPTRAKLGEVSCTKDADEEDAELPEVGVYEDKRVLADPDFDDNLDRTLED